MDNTNYNYNNLPPNNPRLVPDPPKQTSGFATAALVMGICSLVLLCCGAGPVFGALGIIFALLSRVDRPLLGTAKAGLYLSVSGTIISLVVYTVYLVALFQSSEFRDILREYEDFYYYDNYYDDYDYNYDDDYINDLLDRQYNDQPYRSDDQTL